MFRLVRIQGVLLIALGAYLLFMVTGKEIFYDSEQTLLRRAYAKILDAGVEEANLSAPSECQQWIGFTAGSLALYKMFGFSLVPFLLGIVF